MRVDLAGDNSDLPIFGIGVATGEVLADLSSDSRSPLTGAPVELAVRHASQAAPGEVVVASETERLVRAVTSTEAIPAGTALTPQRA